MSDTSDRLNKYIALHTGSSRREADEMIESGRVSVNGVVATIGQRITSSDLVTVDGTPLSSETKLLYVALNKPAGYVCSRKRQGYAPTIYELLPTELHSLKPVGRLDKDSSGVMILSNDGDFALRMTHPRYTKIKRYEVTLDHDLEPLHQQMIADFGVELPDGFSKLHLERSDDTSRRHWTVTMSEGRNRQIRRTFAALGYEVSRLHRIQFGSYEIGGLKAGDSQLVSPKG